MLLFIEFIFKCYKLLTVQCTLYIEDEMIEGLVKRHLDTHEEIYNCDRGIIKMLIISILTSLNFLKFLPIFEFDKHVLHVCG